jgi:hypothetical protein
MTAADLAAVGLRKIAGRHLALVTDLPASEAIGALPEQFSQAVPQWEAYFGPRVPADWLVVGCLMREPERFRRAGLFPAGLPNFANGFAVGRRLWIYEQSADYYRRHLLLHEGVHAYCSDVLRLGDPPWWFEGTAELLGTHRIVDGRVECGWFPDEKEAVPDWGRIKLVRDAIGAERRLSLADVFAQAPDAHLRNESYGWSWAAAAFLDGHPRLRATFRRLSDPAAVLDRALGLPGLDEEARRRAALEFDLFIDELDYGFDLERMAIEFRTTRPLTGPGTVTVRAERGWQSSGYDVEAGRTYRLAATGRFVVGRSGTGSGAKDWPCEAGGITLRYHRGQPLGILLAGVDSPEGDSAAEGGLRTPTVVGLNAELRPARSGPLFFRLNDHPGRLGENRGGVNVRIERVE